MSQPTLDDCRRRHIQGGNHAGEERRQCHRRQRWYEKQPTLDNRR